MHIYASATGTGSSNSYAFTPKGYSREKGDPYYAHEDTDPELQNYHRFYYASGSLKEWQLYDGDGNRICVLQQLHYQPNPHVAVNTSTYYLTSSVLGGSVISELGADGAGHTGYVYAGGEVIAKQYGSSVEWVHHNPVTGSVWQTTISQQGDSPLNLNPIGVDFRVSDSMVKFEP